MNQLRTKWGKRVAAALLLVSLLPVTFATTVHAVRHTATYADWVRHHLRMPADEAVVQALAIATEGASGSLEAFLTSVVNAYEAQHPEQPLAYAFSEEGLSNDALISYLKGRYLGLVGEAVLPRAALSAATVGSQHVFKRGTALLALSTSLDQARQTWITTVRFSRVPLFVLSLRTQYAAQPLGP